MKLFSHILNVIEEKGAAYLILIDPDKVNNIILSKFVKECEDYEVDGFLVGGSLMIRGDIHGCLDTIKKNCSLPTIIFPGDVNQLSPIADAVLFISLISGRNADYLIDKHVAAAPILKEYGLESISTGYMLVESGHVTTAEYVSGSKPIPRDKTDIAVSTALAAEYLGMKMIYLEAGSGADKPVPNEMVKMVTENCSIPVIVGGGIKDSQTARDKVENGAKIIVTGNFFEDESNWHLIKEFADAVHIKKPIEV